jgi:Protein of unknown function (DUF742)
MTTPGLGEPAPIVRPYARTGGRTRSSLDLPLEALITTTAPPGVAADRYAHPDHREIAILCQDVRSVAEVAALLGVPLGVARVLIADMARLGLVTVHNSAPPGGGAPDLALLERVLSGLRRL